MADSRARLRSIVAKAPVPVVLASVAAAFLVSCAPGVRPASDGPQQKRAPATTAAQNYAFGTLLSTQEHATEESRSGVRVAMMELSWRDYEPRPGKVDREYAAYVRSQLATFLAAGRRVTLGLGLSDPPQWVYRTPDSRLVDQHGRRSDELNLIFNETVRKRATEYLRRVARDIPFHNFWAVRIDSGSEPEMVYPGSGSYWAFDTNAQNGPAMPPSMARNPLPGWKPGRKSASRGDVQKWADWYVQALDDVAAWQMTTVTGLGFQGWYQVLTPGSGVRPDAYRKAVRGHLPDGLTGVGAVWARFYAKLPKNPRVVAYVTSMGDGSGGDDVCTAADKAVLLDDARADTWSATRWISRIADEYGMRKNGENPGWNWPSSLNARYRDATPSGMMQSAVRQMQACGFQGIYWAHDRQLWDGTSPFQRLAALVREVNHGAQVLPPMPP